MKTFRLLATSLLVALGMGVSSCEDEITYVDGGYTETSRWSLKDNKLTISYDDGYSDVLTVNELTAIKLVLAFEDWDTMEDGSEELDDITTTTYKKID